MKLNMTSTATTTTTTTDDIEPPKRLDIYNEISQIKAFRKQVETSWETEMRTLEVENIGLNYHLSGNDDNNNALQYFPYHTLFLPLAQCLAGDECEEENNECPQGEWPLPDANICTAEAIQICFDARDIYNFDSSSSSSSVDNYNSSLLWKSMSSTTTTGNHKSAISRASQLLLDDDEGKFVMLKLLRHAMSSLQNDFRLAGVILHQLAKHRLLDDCNYLRHFIVLMHISYPKWSAQCTGDCFQDLIEAGNNLDGSIHHSCNWYKYFVKKLEHAISSISLLTDEHVLLIAAWVQLECDEVSPSAAEWDDLLYGSCRINNANPIKGLTVKINTSEKGKVMKKLSTMVRRTINIGNIESERTCYPYKINMLSSITIGLKNQIKNNLLVPKDRCDYECPAKYHVASVKVLSFIGECVLRRLPDTNTTNDVGSELMEAFSILYISSYELKQRIKNFFDPEKYSRAVSNAARYLTAQTEVPKLVNDIMRGLYFRDIIYTNAGDNESGIIYGYGDWLVHTRQPVSPHDLLLMNHDQNYSLTSDIVLIDFDDAFPLSDEQKRARYDFMILNLVHAWKQPWSANSHLSFSNQFRSATDALVLCMRRFFMPPDIVDNILRFTNRLWWKDDAQMCFCQDCNINDLSFKMQNRIAVRENTQRVTVEADKKKNNNSILCDGCEVVSFCSTYCKKKAMHEGHRKRCSYPPYTCGREEVEFCQQILYNNPFVETEESKSVNDDDSSWESVQSDFDTELLEVNSTSKAMAISNFFSKHTYKYQRSEALPFASFYNDSDED